MDLELVRIELPSGTYALVYKDVLRKTARLHEAELRKYMTPVVVNKGKILMSELEAAPLENSRVDYEIDLVAMDQAKDTINEIFVINQVIEWSFGPVTLETLEKVINRDQYMQLVKELNRLYKPNPLAVQNSRLFARPSMWQSLKVRLSQLMHGKLTT